MISFWDILEFFDLLEPDISKLYFENSLDKTFTLPRIGQKSWKNRTKWTSKMRFFWVIFMQCVSAMITSEAHRVWLKRSDLKNQFEWQLNSMCRAEEGPYPKILKTAILMGLRNSALLFFFPSNYYEVFFQANKNSLLKIFPENSFFLLMNFAILQVSNDFENGAKPQKGEIFQATACLIKATYFTSSAKCQFLSLQLFVMFIH